MKKQLLLLLCGLLAALNIHAQTSVGYLDSWPKPNGEVYAIARSGNTVYIGGEFTTVGGQSRSNIAAIDATTGTLTSWNPGAANDVFCLAVSGNTVYVGGAFFSIGGQSRSNIAAIDATTGNVTSWQPDADNNVAALAVSGNTVYVGGEFITISGQSRGRIAAIDATTGAASSWNPNANDRVATIAVSGSTIYAGGSFTAIGGQSRNSIAALDATTGNASSWNPNANDRVSSIALSGSTLYAAGNFSAIGGQGRNNIAALSTSTGNATAWNPNPNSTVYSLAVNGSRVYASGEFTSIGGQSRGRIAALDATTGNATPWNPNENSVNAEIRFVAVSGSFVYAGGNFSRMAGDTTRRFFMALLDSTSLPPFVTITAAANPICAGASETFNAVPFNAISPTYQWTKNGTAVPGATATTFITNTLANGDTIRCVMTDGGTPTASNPINVTVNALPVASISTSAPNPFCPGTTVPLSASPSGAGNSYLWKLGTTTLSSTTAQQNATAAGSYTVRVTDGNGCVGTSPAFALTTKNPPAAFNLTAGGVTTFCSGGSVTLSPNPGANLSTFPNFQWSNNGVAISGATSLSFPATASGSYTITVSDNGGCGRTSVARAVTVNPLPVASISTAQNPFCAGGTAVLNASPTGTGITYQWMLGTTTLSTTTAQHTANAAGSYTVKVKDGNGCVGTSPSFALSVKTPPSAFSLTASGATTFCSGGSVTLSPNANTNLSGFPNFQWSNNGVAIPGATSLSFSATASGSYTITVSDSTGCRGTSAARAVTVNPLPVPSISTARNPFCAGSTAVLNASPSGAGNNYLWKFGSTTVSGATAATYPTSTAGSYTVTVTDGNGCVGTSPAFALTTKNPPAAFNLTANAATTFCSGGSVTLSPNASANFSGFPNFQWSNNGVVISGATSPSFPATASGSYTLTASDSTGCGRVSVARAVTVNPTPVVTITPLGSTTIGSGGSVTLQANAGTGFTYQWFRNNVAISGATAQNFVANSGGSYTVRVTSGGCSKISAAVVVTQTSNKESLGVTSGGSDALLESTFSISAFPNPADGKVMVRTNGAVSQSATVQVMSIMGVAVKEVEMQNGQTEIDLSGVASGVYLLRYKDGEGRTGILRLVKQ